MLTRSFTRTDEWRALVSDRIRAKWSDPEYRAAVAVGKTTDNVYHVEDTVLKHDNPAVTLSHSVNTS